MVTTALLGTGDQVPFSSCRLCPWTHSKTPTASDPDLSYIKKSDFPKNIENISQVQGFIFETLKYADKQAAGLLHNSRSAVVSTCRGWWNAVAAVSRLQDVSFLLAM